MADTGDRERTLPRTCLGASCIFATVGLARAAVVGISINNFPNSNCYGRNRANPESVSLNSDSYYIPYSPVNAEPEEGPPVPPGRGGALRCVGEPFWAHQNAKNLLAAGAPPRTPLGELTALPQTP